MRHDRYKTGSGGSFRKEKDHRALAKTERKASLIRLKSQCLLSFSRVCRAPLYWPGSALSWLFAFPFYCLGTETSFANACMDYSILPLSRLTVGNRTIL